MMRALSVSVAALILTVAAPAAAQRPTVAFAASAGPTFPLGELGDLVDVGWHVQGTVDFGAGLLPIGVRAEALFQDMRGEAVDARQFAAFLSAVLASPAPGFSPYLLGGAGVYSLDTNDDRVFVLPGSVATNATEFGVNAGAGVAIDMVGFDLLLEARFHHVFTDGLEQQTLPVSLGIRF